MLDTGLGLTMQDRGRPGWRRFGVPIGGAMDPHSADCANRLLENHPGAPLLEMLLQGARLEALRDVWVALTGAEVRATIPSWSTHQLKAGEILHLQAASAGLWAYLAIEGGFDWPAILGSSSQNTRAGLGTPLVVGDSLSNRPERAFRPGVAITSRSASWGDRRDFLNPPHLRVWPGPQWSSLSQSDRDFFLSKPWVVSPQSDRVGYRLEGMSLAPEPREIVSEPVRVGSIQVPDGGGPIVLMRDGPTVGGYPKIAVVEEEDLGWLAQCRPGQSIHFKLEA